jgi:4-oxalocrotonate tautomerase family enzyme
MPIVRVEMLAGRSPELKQRLAAEMTALVARLCNSDPSHIYVMFSDVAHGDWAVAGRVFDNPSTGSGQAVPAGSDA